MPDDTKDKKQNPSTALGASDKENNIHIKKLPDSEIEIEGEISADEFESYYKKTIQKLGKNMELPGFRKGHVPEHVLVQKVGEDMVLNEMAELALASFYPRFVLEKKISVIGKPEITITKIVRKNPLGFKIKTAVLPEFELPDYKTIAEKERGGAYEKIFVEDKEVDLAIDEIRKNFLRYAKGKKEQNDKKETILGPDGQSLSQKQDESPELTDEFVKRLGKFENVADFKKKIKENLTHEKAAKAKEKKRIAIVESILEKVNILLPAILVEGELDRMLAQFKGNISAMGRTFEEDLLQIKKTEAELKQGWRVDAEKSIKTKLLLQKIAEVENIKVSKNELDKEVEHIVKHYPGADRMRAGQYAEGALLNEKVFKFLEGEKNPNNTNKPENPE